MPIYALGDNPAFPRPEFADADGLLAMGGDLGIERLVNAYASGIFPWYGEDEPILWWSPDPRWVVPPAEVHISSSMAAVIRSGKFRVTFDTAFSQVMEACASTTRKGQSGTWINQEMLAAYQALHRHYLAHSVEVWHQEKLVGGLYGVVLGRMFFGESMFSHMSNASKTGFIWLARGLERLQFHLIDCQTHTPHLESLGARAIPRAHFLRRLQQSLEYDTLQMPWTHLHELQPSPV